MADIESPSPPAVRQRPNSRNTPTRQTSSASDDRDIVLQAYLKGDYSLFSPREWEIVYQDYLYPEYEKIKGRLEGKEYLRPTDQEMKFLGVIDEVLDYLATHPTKGDRGAGIERRSAESRGFKEFYHKYNQRYIQDTYKEIQQQLRSSTLRKQTLDQHARWIKYQMQYVPPQYRQQMQGTLDYINKLSLSQQNKINAQRIAAISKQAEAQKAQKQAEGVAKGTEGGASGGADEVSEANKIKTTETPNKPAAPEAKKDPDEELNDIMTMMSNLNKMQDAGADQFHVNWVAQVLARRMAAYSGNSTPGMSDAQYAMLPPHMRSPFGAMVNRASYEQSLRKKTEDYYTNSHLPRPNWLQNLDKLDQSAQIDLLRQMSPALVPDAKSLPGPSRSSWGGMDYKGFSIPKKDSNTISDTPQLKAPSGSYDLSKEEDESRQMGYNPYGTSYPNLGNLSPGMDMSNMLGDNYLMNQMMSRQGVPPYPMA